MIKEISVVFMCFVGVSLALPSNNYNWRVVGGEDAKPGEAPYQGQLLIDGRFNCAVVIICPKTVLTAAHCVTNPQYMKIVVGTNKLSSGGVTHEVKKVIVHENYGTPTYLSNDMAVLILKNKIQFTDVIKPVALDNVDRQDPLSVKLTGWGRIYAGGPIAENLQKVNLMTISHADCSSEWPNQVDKNMICTFTKSGEGACHGDSGGPIVSESGELVGIVSWGLPCAVGKPDAYSRVSSFVDWIENHAECDN